MEYNRYQSKQGKEGARSGGKKQKLQKEKRDKNSRKCKYRQTNREGERKTKYTSGYNTKEMKRPEENHICCNGKKPASDS